MTWGMSHASLLNSDGFLEWLLTYSVLPYFPRFPSLAMVPYWDFYNYPCNYSTPSLSILILTSVDFLLSFSFFSFNLIFSWFLQQGKRIDTSYLLSSRIKSSFPIWPLLTPNREVFLVSQGWGGIESTQRGLYLYYIVSWRVTLPWPPWAWPHLMEQSTHSTRSLLTLS